jgi:hypothetical protein
VCPAHADIGPCHVSGIFLPLRVNSLPLATIYEVKIPLRKWKKSLLQRNPAQMTWAIFMLVTTFPSKKPQNSGDSLMKAFSGNSDMKRDVGIDLVEQI